MGELFGAMIEAFIGLIVLILRPIVVTLGRIFGPSILKIYRILKAFALSVLRILFSPFRMIIYGAYRNRNVPFVRYFLVVLLLVLAAIFIAGIWFSHSGNIPVEPFSLIAHPGFLTLLIPVFGIPLFILLQTRWPKWDETQRRRNIIITELVAGLMLVIALIPSNPPEVVIEPEPWFSFGVKVDKCHEPDRDAGLFVRTWGNLRNKVTSCEGE